MSDTSLQHAPPGELSTAELIERLNTQVTTLIRTEISSAADEMKGKGLRIGIGVGVSGVGLLVVLFGLGALVAAAVLGLATVVDGWLAALIVGAALLLIGGAAAAIGAMRARSATPPVPDKTVESVQSDAMAVKENL